MKEYNVAVLGATGAVGREMIKVLEERAFPVKRLLPLASARSAGKTIAFRGEQVAIDLQNDVQYVSMCPQCYFKARKEFYAKRAEHLSK